MAGRKVTNRPELLALEPDAGWELMEDAEKPAATDFVPGATEPTVQPSETPEAPHAGPQISEAEPRLGMNPQGEWDADRMMRMFPEMFVQPETWLDPEQEARKREGMSYDPKKKYDPSKNREVIRAGAPMPEDLRTDRAKFEEVVFKQIGGNPFMIDPYKKLVEADKDLPALFDHIFKGKATWNDIPRLSKQQLEIWQEAKKRHHARVYGEAKAQKEQMLEAYKYMMGSFDVDQKERKAQWLMNEKERIRQETIQNKAPQLRAVDNGNGDITVHAFYPDGRIVDTGKKTGAASLEDRMPPQIKQAMAILKQYDPKIDSEKQLMLALIARSDPKMAATLGQAGGSQVPEYMRPAVEAARKAVGAWASGLASQLAAQPNQPGAQPSQPGTQTPQTQAQPVMRQGSTITNAPAATAAKAATPAATGATTKSSPTGDLSQRLNGKSPEFVIGKIADRLKKGQSMDRPIKEFLSVIAGHKDYQKYFDMLANATKMDRQAISVLTNPENEESNKYRRPPK